MGENKSMKSWMDITDDEIRDFLMKELKPDEIGDFHRNNKDEEIICTITTTWTDNGQETGDIRSSDAFSVEDEVCITQKGFETEGFDLSDLNHKWQQFQIAKGVHPLQINNPFMKRGG